MKRLKRGVWSHYQLPKGKYMCKCCVLCTDCYLDPQFRYVCVQIVHGTLKFTKKPTVFTVLIEICWSLLVLHVKQSDLFIYLFFVFLVWFDPFN